MLPAPAIAGFLEVEIVIDQVDKNLDMPPAAASLPPITPNRQPWLPLSSRMPG